MTDFVQAKEFPCPVRVYKCYVSPTWIVLERGTRAFTPSTNEMTHMKMSYARSYPIVTDFAWPAGEGLIFYLRSGPKAPPTRFVDKL